LLTRDSQRRRISWSLQALRGQDGTVQSILLSGVDRTESLAALAQLQEAKAAATAGEGVAAEGAGAAGEAADKAAGGRPFQPVEAKAPKEELRSSQRRSYQYLQLIAPIRQGGMPTRADFFQSPCEDISAGGISFYLASAPDFEDVVVALGKPPFLTYFIAHVARTLKKTVDGRAVYLVGCRFTGRVPTETIEAPPQPPR
jgi:hypothetical protein